MQFLLYLKQAGTFKLTESQVFSSKNTLSWAPAQFQAKYSSEVTKNESLTLSGIPQEYFQYQLGNRSALE